MTGPALRSYWSEKRNYSFWPQKLNPSDEKLYVNIKLIFIFNPSYQCIRLKRWYLRVSIDHPEKQRIRQETFSWATIKIDLSLKSIKKNQNENRAPTIRGCVFVLPSWWQIFSGYPFSRPASPETLLFTMILYRFS